MKIFTIIFLVLLVAPLLLGVEKGNISSTSPTTYEHGDHPLDNLWDIGWVYEISYSSAGQDVVEIPIEEPADYHDEPSYTEEDLDLLSRIVSAEARGEPVEGQIAVANVVLNRVASEDFPDTIEGVIYQDGQFSPVSNGAINNEPTEEAIESAKRALDGEFVVESDVLYFYNPKIAKSKWIFTRKTAKVIGNHTFSY